MPALTGSRYCWSHAPDKQEAAHDARKRGGDNTRAQPASPAPADLDLASPAGRMAVVEQAVQDCLGLRNSAQRGKTLALLVRLAFDMESAGEAAELRDQLDDLRRLADEQQQRRTPERKQGAITKIR